MARVLEEMALLNSESQAAECLSDEELGGQVQTDGQTGRGRVWRVAAGAFSSLALLCVVAGVSSHSGGVAARAAREEGIIADYVPKGDPCLCVFDIDRTLTGKQGWAERCAADQEQSGMHDTGYMQGTLLLSQLALKINETACKHCFRGVVTAGVASGPNSNERARIMNALGGVDRTRSDWWQDIAFNPAAKVMSSLVTSALDTKKQDSVLSMVKWWKKDQNIEFKLEDVYFFDDIKENVVPFKGTGINARQVSCEARGPQEPFPFQYPGKLGGCGGTPAEVAGEKGIRIC